VRTEVQRQGIVVWLDKDASYTRFVDGLAARRAAGDFPLPVVGFRGSFLETLFDLETYGSGLDKQPLLIHMPGHNEESIRKTPLLEMYEAGVRFRKLLDTLIREAATGRAAPAEVDRFLASSPTLEQADAWLTAMTTNRGVGLAAMLDQIGSVLLVEALARKDSPLAAHVTTPEDVAVLRDYLHKLTGMDEAWSSLFAGGSGPLKLDGILTALGAWVLCVEYVHDLRRPPHLASLQPLKSLSPQVVKACVELVVRLRKENGEAYARLADEVEAFVGGEIALMTAEDLGQIDTFRAEENRVLEGAVLALKKGEWVRAKAFSDARQGDASFWLQRDQQRRWEWALVGEAAELGAMLAKHGRPLRDVRTLEEAAERYASGAFEVDRAHRRFEQKWRDLFDTRLPRYGLFTDLLGLLRRAHRDWADELTRDFAAICKEQGFLPPRSLQQRALWEDVVHPLSGLGEKVAVFLIDAFRFEMATELVAELGGPGGVVDLKPRFAELPTITSVGMNALAPVAQNDRLVVAGEFGGFKTGEYTVKKPDDRARAMGMRSGGKPALLLKLGEVCEASTPTLLKQIKPHSLVVVCSTEIDDAGEANVGLPTFAATLKQIRAAWHHLQLAGVKHFVFTADHGFLLQDETTHVRPFATKREVGRRHVFEALPRPEAGMSNVSLASLGYEGLSGYLLFRDDTSVFATGTSGASFVHGGNSLQERVIPVLTVTRKRVEQASLAEYEVQVEPKPPAFGLHRIAVRVTFPKISNVDLAFAAARNVELSLHAPTRPGVRAVLKEASAPGVLKAGRVVVPVGEAWSEVFFALEGPSDEQVHVEIHHPDNIERVRPATPEQWYSVSGTGTKKSLPPPSLAPETWSEAITDEGIRKVFLHLEKHGVITEVEATGMVGSARAFRRLSADWDSLVAKVPFRVRIESTEGGKRYVREGDR